MKRAIHGAVAGWAVAALVCNIWIQVLAAPVTGGFLLFGPGAALLGLVPVPGWALRFVVGGACSWSVLAMVSLAMVLGHCWTPSRVVGVEAAVTVALVAVGFVRSRPQPRGLVQR